MNEKSPLWWFLNRTGPGRFLVQVFGPERDGCPSARKVWLTAWWPLPKEQRREVHAPGVAPDSVEVDLAAVTLTDVLKHPDDLVGVLAFLHCDSVDHVVWWVSFTLLGFKQIVHAPSSELTTHILAQPWISPVFQALFPN